MMRNLFNLRYGFAKHASYLLLGGGTGGINVSSNLIRQGIPQSQIHIIEPSEYHYYQPGWTMVGASMWEITPTFRKMKEVIPKGVSLIQSKVKLIKPQLNTVVCQNGEQITYNTLIVGTGLKLDYHKIQGLKEALDDPNSNVGSIYELKYAQKTAKLADNLKSGKAIFTEPSMPIKCPGAPQKLTFLRTDKWNKENLGVKVQFYKTIPVMFAVPKYAAPLYQNAKSLGINVTFKHALIKVEGNKATFQNQDTKELVVREFDFLHAVPHMSAHSYIADSGLSDPAGFLNCDKNTLRHVKHNNIWGIGDCMNTPQPKTAAAIFAQTEELIKNLLAVRKNPTLGELPGKYGGYTSCPLFVGKQKLILAEFKYNFQVQESFSTNQDVPRFSFYLMKRFLFPLVYWYLMPRGQWRGRKGIRLS